MEVLLAIAIIGVIVTLFSETLFQFAKLKEQGQSEAMDYLSGPQIIAEIQDVLLRIRKCPDPTRSVVRKESAAQSSELAVKDEKQLLCPAQALVDEPQIAVLEHLARD